MSPTSTTNVRDSIFETQPWETFKVRDISDGRTPSVAILMIHCRVSWLRGRPLTNFPPSWFVFWAPRDCFLGLGFLVPGLGIRDHGNSGWLVCYLRSMDLKMAQNECDRDSSRDKICKRISKWPRKKLFELGHFEVFWIWDHVIPKMTESKIPLHFVFEWKLPALWVLPALRILPAFWIFFDTWMILSETKVEGTNQTWVTTKSTMIFIYQNEFIKIGRMWPTFTFPSSLYDSQILKWPNSERKI